MKYLFSNELDVASSFLWYFLNTVGPLINNSPSAEILVLYSGNIIPTLSDYGKIEINTLIELFKKDYDYSDEYIIDNIILLNLLLHYKQFGLIINKISPSLKKIGIWFRAPIIKIIKQECLKDVYDQTNLIYKLIDIISEGPYCIDVINTFVVNICR